MSSKNTDIESALVSVHLALAQLCVVFYHISSLVLSVINDRLSALRPHKSSKCVLTKTVKLLKFWIVTYTSDNGYKNSSTYAKEHQKINYNFL